MRFCIKPSTLLHLLLAAQFASTAPIIALIEPQAQKTLALKTTRVSRPALSKRQTINEPVENDVVMYTIEVGIGSPYQTIRMDIDTGSSDTWIYDRELCLSEPGCSVYYNPNASSSYVPIPEGYFSIGYGDKNIYGGPWFYDTVQFDEGQSVVLQMALVNHHSWIGAERPANSDTWGLMGLGLSTNEADAQHGKTYPALIDELVNQNVIKLPIYSLWLDSLKAPHGNILFGGVNETSYEGDLSFVPVVPSLEGGLRDFKIPLDGYGVSGSKHDLANTTVILDSGTTHIHMSWDRYNAIVSELPFTVDKDFNVDCDLPHGSVDFYFGNKLISVPFHELTVYKKENGKCRFGLAWGLPLDGVDMYLGDTFLRSVYVVYDYNGNQPTIGLAQTKFSETS